MTLSAGLLDKARSLATVQTDPVVLGRVARIAGLLIEVTMPGAGLGELVVVVAPEGDVPCEIVGFRDGRVLAIALGDLRGVAPGAEVRALPASNEIAVGDGVLGRVVDPFGNPLDGRGELHCADRVAVHQRAPAVADRDVVRNRFDTGVRVIDGLLTCGRGQRVGIFAGAGVGKSVLVEQIAGQSFADVTVVGLIGERGREVREMMTGTRSSSTCIVAATSDRSPMERIRGARVATSIAEYFRDRGANVLLIIDSLTRYAMALREVGLSVGEPPATKGYPPSVFAALPLLLERVAPMAHGGSITGFYTVLVEGDDLSDPVADSARSLLDAHIVLSRSMASKGQFPAIDVLRSASRVANQVTTGEAQKVTQRVRETLATRETVVELQSLGAYVPGRNETQDEALRLGDSVDAWARQRPDERSDYEASMTTLEMCVAKPAKDNAG